MNRPLALSTVALTALVTSCGLPTIEEATSSLEQTLIDCTDEDGCGPSGRPLSQFARPSVYALVHQLDGIVERATVSISDRGAEFCAPPAEAEARIDDVTLPLHLVEDDSAPCPGRHWQLREHAALPVVPDATSVLVTDGETTIAFAVPSYTEPLLTEALDEVAAAGEALTLEVVGGSGRVLEASAFAADAEGRAWRDLSVELLDDGTVTVRLPVSIPPGEGLLAVELQAEPAPTSCFSTVSGQQPVCYGLLRAESHHPITIE